MLARLLQRADGEDLSADVEPMRGHSNPRSANETTAERPTTR